MKEELFVKKLASILKQGPDVLEGPGDDCAAIDLGLEELLLAAADQVVSDVHFEEGRTKPAAVAKKLLNRNLSDIAAMGGRPTHALVTIALNPVDKAWLEDFHKGLQEAAAPCGVSIVGGDISSSKAPGHFCSLSILGRVAKGMLCLRSNAQAGELLYCSGSFGNSFLSGKHLDFSPRLAEGRFLAGRFTKAMMDVSDGLLKDARRMAEASKLALEIDLERIPLAPGATLDAALSEGEDYELIMAVPQAKAAELERLWPFKETPLTCIGKFIEGPCGEAFNRKGERLSSGNDGFDHFNEKDSR